MSEQLAKVFVIHISICDLPFQNSNCSVVFSRCGWSGYDVLNRVVCGRVSLCGMYILLPCLTTASFALTGNVWVRGDSVKWQQAGQPRQSAAAFPRICGKHFPFSLRCIPTMNTKKKAGDFKIPLQSSFDRLSKHIQLSFNYNYTVFSQNVINCVIF